MILKQVLTPSEEPITLAEAKAHLRVDGTDENDYITSLITVARLACELEARRAFVEQTFDLFLDCWPDSECGIKVPRPPLQSVTSLSYTDYAGNVTALVANTDYVVDTNSEPGRILPAYGKFWPTALLHPGGAIKVRFVAGYGIAEDVPDIYKHAIKLTIGHFFENREDVVVQAGLSAVKLPLGVAHLLGLDRGDF